MGWVLVHFSDGLVKNVQDKRIKDFLDILELKIFTEGVLSFSFYHSII